MSKKIYEVTIQSYSYHWGTWKTYSYTGIGKSINNAIVKARNKAKKDFRQIRVTEAKMISEVDF
jgi:hypothetical protein